MWIDEIILPIVDPMLPGAPSVGDHNDQRIDTVEELGRFVIGFKDGMVGVIGEESKAYQCNANLTLITDIYFYNYKNLFDGTRFTEDLIEYDNSVLDLMDTIKQSIEWPYFVLYNCYWGGVEIYTPA